MTDSINLTTDGILTTLKRLPGYEQVAEAAALNTVVTRYLVPNDKFNTGITFVIPFADQVQDMLADASTFDEIFCKHVLPVQLSSVDDVNKYVQMHGSVIPIRTFYSKSDSKQMYGVSIGVKNGTVMIGDVPMQFSSIKTINSHDAPFPRSITYLRAMGIYNPVLLKMLRKRIDPIASTEIYGGGYSSDTRQQLAADLKMEFMKDPKRGYQLYINACVTLAGQLKDCCICAACDVHPVICFYFLAQPFSAGKKLISNVTLSVNDLSGVNMNKDSFLSACHCDGNCVKPSTDISFAEACMGNVSTATLVSDYYNGNQENFCRDLVRIHARKCFRNGDLDGLLKVFETFTGDCNDLIAKLGSNKDILCRAAEDTLDLPYCSANATAENYGPEFKVLDQYEKTEVTGGLRDLLRRAGYNIVSV